jgi:hypothetical protein
MEGSSFDDNFGDFGDFHAAQDGELTPTADSWSFTSGSTASDEVVLEDSSPLEGTSNSSGIEIGPRNEMDGP